MGWCESEDINQIQEENKENRKFGPLKTPLTTQDVDLTKQNKNSS